jgi:ubiquinone/menaquinone biosynthesis C-methylase UbiE
MIKNQPGERLEPGITGDTMREHLHRYAIALDMANGKDVLDFACGEGYGAMLLAGKARSVTAIDIDEPTIKKAISKYKAGNLHFKSGSVPELENLKDQFHLVTSFETIEHLDNHEEFLSALKKTMKPGGLLLLSTPEKASYSDKTGYKNPFHKKELYGDELKQLIQKYFKHARFYGQVSICGSLILDENNQILGRLYEGDLENIETVRELDPAYWFVLASDGDLPEFSPGFFSSGMGPDKMLYEQTKKVKKTITYRLGAVLLVPFRLLLSVFRK